MSQFNVGDKVVRSINRGTSKRGYTRGGVSGISRDYGVVVEVNEVGRTRVKWTHHQWSPTGTQGEIKPLGRNLRTWNKPSTLELINIVPV